MLLLFFLISCLGLCLMAFLRQAKFGKAPSGVRLERIRRSPNYAHGHFANQTSKPRLTEGASYCRMVMDFLFFRGKDTQPAGEIPSCKTDLRALGGHEDVLVWFGHSSYFLQVGGKKIVVDPVLGSNASPVALSTKAFAGTSRYTPDDLPEIDYLFITHDHWDHLDYETVSALKAKTGKVICPLGVGEHLEYWGFEPERMLEADWHERLELGGGFIAHVTPTQHFSGRDLKHNRSLWAAYVLETPTLKVYFGGDGGYGPHFAETGARFGGVDLAILENGQYDKRWKYMHMRPEETLQAAEDLRAKTLFPVHSGKFNISYHRWDEPLTLITALNEGKNQRLITPMIGERVDVMDETQTFSRWWEGLK